MRQLNLTIDDMTGARCAQRVELVLRQLVGVAKARVNLSEKARVLKHGKPVRLNFRRQENAGCSEKVLSPDIAGFCEHKFV